MHRYLVRRMTFAEYMAKQLRLHPLIVPPEEDFHFTRPQLNEIIRRLSRNNINIWRPALMNTEESYRQNVNQVIRAVRNLFVDHFSDPRATRFTVRNATITMDIRARISTQQVSTDLILLFIFVAIMLVIYIEYNIYFRRY